MRERWRKGKIKGGVGTGKVEFLERKRVQKGKEERVGYEGMEGRDKRKQKKERWEKIGESRYNRLYKEIKKEGIPGYLNKG